MQLPLDRLMLPSGGDDHTGRILEGVVANAIAAFLAVTGYLCYSLMAPYVRGIAWGALLSVVFHPSAETVFEHGRLRRNRRDLTVHRIERTLLLWGSAYKDRTWAVRALLGGLVPRLLSIRHVAAHELFEAAEFLGLGKISFVSRLRSRGYWAQCAAAWAVLSLASTVLSGFPVALVGQAAVLLVVLLLRLLPLTSRQFVTAVSRFSKAFALTTFSAMLIVNFAHDVAAVRDAVSSGTSSLVDSSLVDASVLKDLYSSLPNRVLEDVAAGFNSSNVTETALGIRRAVEPLLSDVSAWGSMNWTEQYGRLVEALDAVPCGLPAGADDPDGLCESNSTGLLSAVRKQGVGVTTQVLVTTLASRWLPYVEVGLSVAGVLVSKLANVLDAFYEVLLFATVYRFCTAQRNTLLFSFLVRLLSVSCAASAVDRARALEEDLIQQFLSLFQSFWHITWFHFTITFGALSMAGVPLPFLFGLVAVLLALFPMFPRSLCPCTIAAIIVAVQCARHWEIQGAREAVLLAANVLIFNSDWLLSVQKRARRQRGGSRAGNGNGNGGRSMPSPRLGATMAVLGPPKQREELPTFVVGTSVVLGLVVYGLQGIVIGPLTFIVARSTFENFGFEAPDTSHYGPTTARGPSAPSGGLQRSATDTFFMSSPRPFEPPAALPPRRIVIESPEAATVAAPVSAGVSGQRARAATPPVSPRTAFSNGIALASRQFAGTASASSQGSRSSQRSSSSGSNTARGGRRTPPDAPSPLRQSSTRTLHPAAETSKATPLQRGQSDATLQSSFASSSAGSSGAKLRKRHTRKSK